MSEVYIPLEQAAMYEGIGYKAMSKRIITKANDYKIQEISRPNGGKPIKQVALSSLSPKARKAHKAAQKVDGGDAVQQDNPSECRPWYVDVDFHWFVENHEQEYYKAIDLKNKILEFLQYDDAGRTEHTGEIARELGISSRSLYRYVKDIMIAEAWANTMEGNTGRSHDHFQVLCLCRKPRDSGNFPSLLDWQRALIENIWIDKGFAGNRSTVQMLYDDYFKPTCEKAQEYVPSYQTVARYVRTLEKRYGNARILSAKGLRAWKAEVMVKTLRDTRGVPVMGILQGDVHTLDFFVAYTDPSNGKVIAIRPNLIAWIDTRSRRIFGALMTRNVNAQITKLSIAKMIYEAQRVPECLLIDNGKEFTAKELLGRERDERSSHEPLLILDSEAEGFLHSVGIRDDYRSLPYQPWGKGPVERFFDTVCLQFSRRFGSYVGTLTASKTSSKVQKDAKKLLEQGRLVTMEDAMEQFEQFLEKYHKKMHRGLKDAGEEWTSPGGVFENAEEQYMQAPPAPAVMEMLLMKAESAYVRQIGIQRFGYIYRDDALWPFINRHVNIRWDPSDLSVLHVYDRETKEKICTASRKIRLGYNGRANPDALEEHLRTQNRQLAHDRANKEYLSTPHEIRAGLAPVAGLPDLMIEGKKSKVVAMPSDAQYRQDVRTSSKKKSNEPNPFLEELADNALEELRKIAQ